jgi:hypothetical protein
MRRDRPFCCHYAKPGSGAEDVAEPRSCISPFLASEVDRDTQGGRNILVSQSGKLTEFDHLCGDWVFDLQPVESFVEREKILVWVGSRHINKFRMPNVTAAFYSGLAPRGLDEDVPHRAGGRGKKVALAVPLAAWGGADNSQVRFVNQCRGLKRVSRRFVSQLPGCQSAELVVNQGKQFVGRLPVALFDRGEDSYCLVHHCNATWFHDSAMHLTHTAPTRWVASLPVTEGLLIDITQFTALNLTRPVTLAPLDVAFVSDAVKSVASRIL